MTGDDGWHSRTEFGKAINNQWGEVITGKIYPLMDKAYKVLENKNATIKESESMLDEYHKMRFPVFPELTHFQKPHYESIYKNTGLRWNAKSTSAGLEMWPETYAKKVGERFVYYDKDTRDFKNSVDFNKLATLNNNLNDEYLDVGNALQGKLNGKYEWQKFEEKMERRKREEELKKQQEARFNILSAQIKRVENKLSDLSYDFKKNILDKKSEIFTIRNELQSKISTVSKPVTQEEHEESINQLFDTINEFDKRVNKRDKEFNDTISKLQKDVNMSQIENSQTRGRLDETRDIVLGINKSMREKERDLQGIIFKQNSLLFEFHDVREKVYKKNDDIKADLNNTKTKLEALKADVQKKEERTIKNVATINRHFKQNIETHDEFRSKINITKRLLDDLAGKTKTFMENTERQKRIEKWRAQKRISPVGRIVQKAAFPDLTKRPWLANSVTGRFFQLVNQW